MSREQALEQYNRACGIYSAKIEARVREAAEKYRAERSAQEQMSRDGR